ncbi:MAG: phenylalanyl-tRNA synthetase, beta subunit [Frankiales bacterium]|nr:phenylalanyl-tRNA synthetase, beta subunit [Frankiales bacterium]
MRVPLSWLRTLVPALSASADDVAAALVRAGLEVEQVHRYGDDVRSVVVGEVLDVEELTGFKKPIRFCHVDVGTRSHEVVCGARNFAAGDRVAFALPGASLPGGFEIATRQTYGRTSDGMICSEAELGLSDESDGILVLAPDAPLGVDVVEHLSLRDEVLDIAVTPDRGYTLSVRGVAREVATAFGLELVDPGLAPAAPATDDGPPVTLQDDGCTRYVARLVTGLDPAAPSPAWLQRRLVLAGMRPISLAVDVTNHVMLELGQPLHAFDADRLQGGITVRRALAGERLTTLDGKDRALDEADLVIADTSGAVAVAGVMGGAATEVTATTTTLLLESARFEPVAIAKTARRHRLPSEASKRYERGVDPALAPAAAEAAVRLLVEHGGATAGPVTDVDSRPAQPVLAFPVGAPERIAGRPYARDVVVGRLQDVGCTVTGEGDVVEVVPPSWRPDLTGTAELVEEVVRLEGYDTIPVALPSAPAGRGLTRQQGLRRTASRALAAGGLVEVVTPPFVGEQAVDLFGAGGPSPRLVNPLSAEQALLRPSLLPGLLAALARNASRGLADVALFETGPVFLGAGGSAPTPGVDGPPTPEQRAALDAALPAQPRHAGVVLTGAPASWDAAVSALVDLGRALGLVLVPRALQQDPFHPGRCAELLLDGRRVGLAGELHPRVVATLGLPARTCAAEADLDVLVEAAAALDPVRAPVVSHYPPSSVDVALVVEAAVAAADVEAALRSGAGELLEDLHLFDVFTGPQVGEGRRSLAYALRFRAPDRTLTDVEVLGARDAAVALAGERTGAVLRA